MLAPWVLFLRVMIVTSSMPALAWTAVPALTPVPTALSAPLNNRARKTTKRVTGERPPDTRKHTVLPVSIRLKSTEKTPACVSMWAFLQPISARIYFGKTASHRKRARFVQSRGASPQAYWMSVKAAQRWGCAKRAFYGVCFLMPGGLTGVLFYETVEKACYCEPVRAAKQVPLGYTLARQSVSKTYKSCAFRRFLPEKMRIPTSLRAAKQVPLGYSSE